MCGMPADGFAYGGIKLLIVPHHIFGCHAYKRPYPVLRETLVHHCHVGQFAEQPAHFGGAQQGVIHVYLEQSAVFDEVLHRVSAAAHSGGNDAGHPVLHRLRFGFMPRLVGKAAVFLHLCLECVAAHFVYILLQADSL